MGQKGCCRLHDFSVLWSGKYHQYWEVLPHSHGYYQIIAVLKGSGEILIDGCRYTLADHRVFLIHPNAEHAIPHGKDDIQPQLLDIKFTVNDDPLANDLSRLPAVLDVGNFSLFQNYFEQILRESAKGEPYSYQCICCYFGLLLAQLLRAQSGMVSGSQEAPPGEAAMESSGDSGLNKVVGFIQQNYATPIVLDDLARIVNVSKSTLIQTFKTALHTTPLQYINRIRLEKAKDLLLNTDSSISEISEMVGFQSIHYFSRYFKNREQISPAEYRQRYSSSHFYTYRQPNGKEDLNFL